MLNIAPQMALHAVDIPLLRYNDSTRDLPWFLGIAFRPSST